MRTYVGQLVAMNDLLHKFLPHQDDSMKDYSKFALCTFSFNFFFSHHVPTTLSKFAMFEPYTQCCNGWWTYHHNSFCSIENYGKNSEVLSIAASQCLFWKQFGMQLNLGGTGTSQLLINYSMRYSRTTTSSLRNTCCPKKKKNWPKLFFACS